MYKNSLPCALCYFLFIANAFSGTPSFDCKKASSGIEKSICADNQLSEYDLEMYGAYKKAITSSQEKDIVKAKQIEWLGIRNKCNDNICLKDIYLTRITELNSYLSDKAKSESPVSQKISAESGGEIRFKLIYGDSYPVCKPFVDMLNETHYSQFPSCSRELLPQFTQFKKIEWVEITNMELVKEIILRVRERELLYMRNLVNTSLQEYAKRDLQFIEEGKLKLYEYVMDIDGDMIDDHIYKSVKNVPSLEKFHICTDVIGYYLEASTITLDKAKTLSQSPFFQYNLNGSNELFLFGKKLLSSNWSVGADKDKPNLDIYWNKKICGISVN